MANIILFLLNKTYLLTSYIFAAMSLPTLLKEGYLIPPAGTSKAEKKRLENVIPIDYVINFLEDRNPGKRRSAIKIKPKKGGDRVLVFKANTGSGKSTALPVAIYKRMFENTNKNIIVTQPRILTAVDTPSNIVTYTPELELDKNIGYNTGVFKRLPKQRGIIFSTIGVLTQQLITSPAESFMKKYQFIIIDEVHERDIETDLCLVLLKKLLSENYDDPECPFVIITSATFDENIFMDFFDVPKSQYIEVAGSTFPIEANFTDYSISNYTEFASMKARQLHLANLGDLEETNVHNKFRDIIIFVRDSGVGMKIYSNMHKFNTQVLDKSPEFIQQYADSIGTQMEKYHKGGAVADTKYYILPILLDSRTFEAGGLEYQNLFSNLETIHVPFWRDNATLEQEPTKYVTPVRRVIIATNVAETGVTIETLKYCIDTGYHFNVEFNPETGCNVMYGKAVTHGMAVQRRGRVGRKAPGIWYACYTEDTFNSLQKDQFSKIIVSDITETMLGILIKEKETGLVEAEPPKKNQSSEGFQMHSLTMHNRFKLVNPRPTNIAALDFIELPSMQSMSHSLEKLRLLGFIDSKYDITVTGYYANQIRFISIECRKMIMSGYYYGANVLDLITISSFVYVTRRRVFTKKFQITNFLKQNEADFEFYSRILIADDFINCIFIWNILQGFIQKSLSGISVAELDKIDNMSKQDYKKILYTDDLKQWCEENEIIYDGLLRVIAIRDQIIENIIIIGLNPYYNNIGLPKNLYNLNKIMQTLDDGLIEIKKIKQCLYEGFKSNVLISRKYSYVSILKGIPIQVKSRLIMPLNSKVSEQQKPLYILVDQYTLAQKFGMAQFEFVADGFISVLDNYIDIDEAFYSC
jgi:HrpA-like RNA helicase